MPYVADRVKDASSSTGTGTFAISGTTSTGYVTFATGFGSSPVRVNYVIDDGAGNWEVGAGTWDGSANLTREQVKSSSNAGALVNFASGTKSVYCDVPSEQIRGANYGIHMAFNLNWPLP